MTPAPSPIDIAPSNIEAEQALLGCLLYDNDAFHRIDGLKPAHFFEPFHQRLYDAIATLVGKGQLAEPILLADRFTKDEGFEEFGGVRYLADLVDRAPPAANAREYAAAILALSVRRDLIRISGEIAEAAADPQNEQSAAEQVEAAELELFSLGETQSRRGFRPFSEYAAGAVEMAAKAFERVGGMSGISTGLIDLDAKLGGLADTDLIILGGRPSMGKSSLAVNIGYSAARDYAFEPQPDGTHKTVSGARVGFFSLEMSGDQLALRILAERSGVSGDRLRRGDVQPHEFGQVRDAALEINAMPFYIDDTGNLTIGQLATRARRLKRTVGLDLLIVDYIQLLSGSKRYTGGERTQEVSEITVGLKALAKELSIPVLALAQLSRAVEQREDKRPQLADLRESGSIEQDADVVMFCYREEYYVGRTEPEPGTEKHFKWLEAMDQCRGQAEIIIGKARHGPIGTVRVTFNGDLTKFGNAERAPRFDAGAPRSPHASD